MSTVSSSVQPSRSTTVSPSYQPSRSTIISPSNYYVQCAPFSATNTNSAQQNTVSCTFTACSGDSFLISNCGGSTCSGDTYIRLYDSNNNMVCSNDDYCGVCSQITYSVPSLPSQCSVYTLKQGCYASVLCSGTFLVQFLTVSPTLSSTTLIPTSTSNPTLYPTTLKPTSSSNTTFSLPVSQYSTEFQSIHLSRMLH